MARLIDADALKAALEGLRAERDISQMIWSSDVECVVDDAPTEEAIPVEWLRDRMLDPDNIDQELSKSAWRVMKAWREER